MTSPPQQIHVRCPRCGREYDDWYRPSVNLDLDDFDEEYLRQASTATCPDCGHTVEIGTLVVDGGVWTFRGPIDLDATDRGRDGLGSRSERRPVTSPWLDDDALGEDMSNGGTDDADAPPRNRQAGRRPGGRFGAIGAVRSLAAEHARREVDRDDRDAGAHHQRRREQERRAPPPPDPADPRTEASCPPEVASCAPARRSRAPWNRLVLGLDVREQIIDLGVEGVRAAVTRAATLRPTRAV